MLLLFCISNKEILFIFSTNIRLPPQLALKLSLIRLTIPLKEVSLNFGNILPWFIAHRAISKASNVGITGQLRLTLNAWLFEDRGGKPVILNIINYQKAKAGPQNIKLKSSKVSQPHLLLKSSITKKHNQKSISLRSSLRFHTQFRILSQT